ncbi:MAG: hypothetical protein IIB56_02395 [Planctomycetes bacterium]|nr:hypothetical protein [Planctomycetota bacterium]MCH8119321.1 hypothetical protein [Planctomycetota bacterium]
MDARKKCLVVVTALALVGVFLGVDGCGRSGTGSSKAGKAFGASVELCIKCGQIKGSDLCCKPNQTKCSSCGLVKGSPGCCNIPKDAQTTAICTKCGQIKGNTLCCKPNQPKCPKCGLVKGSPGCCKIPKG